MIIAEPFQKNRDQIAFMQHMHVMSSPIKRSNDTDYNSIRRVQGLVVVTVPALVARVHRLLVDVSAARSAKTPHSSIDEGRDICCLCHCVNRVCDPPQLTWVEALDIHVKYDADNPMVV